MKRLFFSIMLSLLIGGSAFAQTQTVATKNRCYLLTDKYALRDLYGMPISATSIGTVPKNRSLNVLAIDTVCYIFVKVQYKNKIGWIHKDALVDKSLMKNPRVRDEFSFLVSQRKIAIGMNMDEVIESWGYPPKKNTTVTSNSTSEQWIYSVEANKYVYFENGIVNAMQF